MTPEEIVKLRSDLNIKFSNLSAEARGKWAAVAAGSDYRLAQSDPVGARACVANLHISLAATAAPARIIRDEFLLIFDTAINSNPANT